MDQLVSSFLDFLRLEKREANLFYLNSLIEQHQKKVKWETLTKIIDWEKGDRTGNFLPSIEEYINRMVQLGAGGTCWTHAQGLHWLLTQLGFSVHYLYMDPGHICLRVDLDQPYYVDVGYCAPLFKAFPLFHSFKVEDQREVFDYQSTDQKITITRTAGPAKTLNPIPVQLEEMESLIKQSNDWEKISHCIRH